MIHRRKNVKNIRSTILSVKTVLFVMSIVLLSGCKTYDNFTTFFNTYYNMDRLIWESEYDFEGTEIMKRQKPRVLTPIDSGMRFGYDEFGRPAEIPQFIKDIIIESSRLQSVKVKLDSVIIKGSKILKQHPQSNYIEGTLLLMAKSFFYQNEWVSAEIKCSELIDRFPMGDLSPDAHLLLSKIYLIQRKYALGKTMLSRTVDIAWYKKRYDILSEAFRFMAEQAIFENDEDAAVRPYRQAIAQSDDGEIRARWQLELASLYYRLGKFDRALKEFDAVLDESPELVQEFEAELYKASCLLYLNKFSEAERILKDLDGNDNFKEFKPDITAQKMRSLRLQEKNVEFDQLAKESEKYVGNPAIPVAYFEQGMNLFNNRKFEEAKQYFMKSKTVKSPVSQAAGKYFGLIGDWSQKHTLLSGDKSANIDSNQTKSDSIVVKNCFVYYQLARIHDQLGIKDSAEFYYTKAALESVPSDSNRARYLYGYQRILKVNEPEKADSILEVLAYEYGKSEYGKEAGSTLGFTKEVTIDTLGELYSSGIRFRNISNFILAARQFNRIAEEYRDSPLAPKSLYALGWMFENNINDRDSALYYYRLLVERYPSSEYAKDVRSSVEIALANKSGMYDIKTGKIIINRPVDSTQVVPSNDTVPAPKQDSMQQSKTLEQDNTTKTIINPNAGMNQREPLRGKSGINNPLINPQVRMPANAVLPNSAPISLPNNAPPGDSLKSSDPP